MAHCPTCGIRFLPTAANPTYCTPACWPQVQQERPPGAAAQRPVRPTPAAKSNRRNRSERFAALNAFVDMGMANLTGAETKVWLILYRDTKGTGTACTGQADIARRAGLTTRGVQKVLDKLQTKGLVHVVRRGRLHAGPSVYRIQPMPS
jgi:hypothetical protein